MKLREHIIGLHKEAKIYRDSEWQEWRVKFYDSKGNYLGEDCDYHTDDKFDAQSTAKFEIDRPIAKTNDETTKLARGISQLLGI